MKRHVVRKPKKLNFPSRIAKLEASHYGRVTGDFNGIKAFLLHESRDAANDRNCDVTACINCYSCGCTVLCGYISTMSVPIQEFYEKSRLTQYGEVRSHFK